MMSDAVLINNLVNGNILTMGKAHRNNLRHCLQKIVDDLDVRDVLYILIENEILDEESHELLYFLKYEGCLIFLSSPPEKIQCLSIIAYY